MRWFKFKLLQDKYKIIKDIYAKYVDKVQCFFSLLFAKNNLSISYIKKKLKLFI